MTTQQKSLLARARPFIIIAVVGAVYFRGLSGGLLLGWDDDRFIVDSETANDVSLGSLASMFTAQHFEAYHPLHLLSYWLDVPWFGHGGPAIHVVSLALWIAALLVLLKVLDRFGLSPAASLLAVLFFGLHPIQVEAVTWATGRKDILAALFSFLTLLSHMKSQSHLDGNAWATRAFYACAALSKTTTLPLPGVLLLYDLLIARKGWRRSLAGQIPLLLLGGALAAVVVAIWSGNDMIRPDTIAGAATRAAASVTHHVLTAIAPLDTAAVYPVNRPGDFAWTAYLIPAALLAALFVSLWRRWHAGAFVLSAFLLLMLPVANVVPMYWHWMDRYLSLPLFCFALGLGLLLDRLERRPRVAVGVTAYAASALLLLALSARTAVHHVRYTDDLALWEHAAIAQPEAFHAWKKLGEQRLKRGEPRKAVDAFERAIGIEPASKLAHANLAQAHALRDELDGDLEPSRIEQIGLRYMKHADDPVELRKLAELMDLSGYETAVEFLLERALALSPMSPTRMLREAELHARAGHDAISRFYAGRIGGEALRSR